MRKKKTPSPNPLTDTGKIRRDVALKNSMNRSYLFAVLFMTFIAIAGAAGILYLRPESDLVIVLATVFGFTAPTTLSLLAYLKSQETHLSVNSRLDEFIRNAASSARDQGVRQGMAEANDRTDKLAKSSKSQE